MIIKLITVLNTVLWMTVRWKFSGLKADIWNHTISSLFNKNLYNL